MDDDNEQRYDWYRIRSIAELNDLVLDIVNELKKLDLALQEAGARCGVFEDAARVWRRFYDERQVEDL